MITARGAWARIAAAQAPGSVRSARARPSATTGTGNGPRWATAITDSRRSGPTTSTAPPAIASSSARSAPSGVPPVSKNWMGATAPALRYALIQPSRIASPTLASGPLMGSSTAQRPPRGRGTCEKRPAPGLANEAMRAWPG